MKIRLPSILQAPRFARLRAAFSLVEVVLAVGIMSLGVVTILGLLPHGMNISRDTANELAETRIIDQIVGELQAGDWETLSGVLTAGNSGVRRFFDDQGLEVAQGSSNLADVLSYVVRVRAPDATTYNGYMMPPGSTGGAVSQPNMNLRRVVVELVSVPLQNFNFDSPPAGTRVKRFTQLVAKMRVNPQTVTVN